ncbi:MAG: methyltransferase domain-containing protein [Nitrospinae bacterium]|nr:methyltransferase domain-containing protein [Nitrospinota bacterium]
MTFLSKLAHKAANFPFVKRALAENRFIVRMYFNWKYKKQDPYHVGQSDYEKEKLDRAMAALAFKDSFDNVLEVGCGEGFMTEALAGKAAHVLAVDISDIAVKRTAERTAGTSCVTAKRMDVFTTPPSPEYDLVVCSEVLYYFEPEQLPGAVENIIGWIRPGGHAALIHARAKADDTTGIDMKKFGAATIHGMFGKDPRFTIVSDDVQPLYRITVARKEL